ncbi:uncharacterized protein LOC123322785 [Coccinella septempunctata]|uniref:uncharacterized protein LOC123322785 n=1 Tax=Coccinella septempunctata TaxID=41139 RepID=UPI001D077243|nr:uncharacterized protein LOC123322785 [Coccinella septempunctata]
MVVSNSQEIVDVQIEGVRLEQVTSFKYSEVQIEENGKQDLEINSRLESTLKIYHAMNENFLSRKEISRSTKMNVYKAIYRPILTFACESWVLDRRQRSRMQAMEMKYLRKVKEITRMHRVRNDLIREDIGIEPLQDFKEKRQLTC